MNGNATNFVKGILAGDRATLARAITLIESNAPKHMLIAEEILHELMPHTGKSLRIGITGVPGAGKSTFIEAFGSYLCTLGKRVAVLAVDPSSSLSHGSILGDKTRMESLAREPHCFIRPSPAGGTLGGVARKSRETILLCEAGGFDVILVETVGVGQSETTVRSMVDFFLVLMLAGAGDELQGIKKGIIELADAIAITKADGENVKRAEAARAEFSRVLHYLTPPTPGWHPPALLTSAMTGQGIKEVWDVIERFREETMKSGYFLRNRQSQVLSWVSETMREELWHEFQSHPAVASAWPDVEARVRQGLLSPGVAARRLLKTYHRHQPN